MTVVLLHGALGAAQMAPLAERLRADGPVHVVELTGHGATPGPDRPFAMIDFVEHVAAALDAERLTGATLVGYSMGGYVALLLAAAYPERVGRVVTLGTKFRWDVETAEREARRLDPAVMQAKVPRFVETLAARHAHAGGWERVVTRTAALLRELGRSAPLTDDTLRAVPCPARLIVGDRDATVSVEETAGAYRLLGAGSLAVLPETPHPIEQADVGALAALVR